MKKEKFIKRWEIINRKGIKRFILIRTLMMSITFPLGTALGYILRDGFSDSINDTHFFIKICYSFIGGCIGGLIGSPIGWQINEEKYIGLLERKNSDH